MSRYTNGLFNAEELLLEEKKLNEDKKIWADIITSKDKDIVKLKEEITKLNATLNEQYREDDMLEVRLKKQEERHKAQLQKLQGEIDSLKRPKRPDTSSIGFRISPELKQRLIEVSPAGNISHLIQTLIHNHLNSLTSSIKIDNNTN